MRFLKREYQEVFDELEKLAFHPDIHKIIRDQVKAKFYLKSKELLQSEIESSSKPSLCLEDRVYAIEKSLKSFSGSLGQLKQELRLLKDALLSNQNSIDNATLSSRYGRLGRGETP